jgi:hypothetical protein
MKWLLGIALALTVAGTASAQMSPMETKTIELKHLKPAEAVKLLRPYIVNGAGGVFDVSESIPIITIKDLAENIAKMEKVLAKYDHSPATIRLVFQLIEADTGVRTVSMSTRGTPLSVDLDSTLRSVLRFPVYRLLAQGVATTGEQATVSQQMGDASDGLVFKLRAFVGSIKLQEGSTSGTVRIDVGLSREGLPTASGLVSETVMGTALDVPLGNTVVLGTASTRIGGTALILTVRPELLKAK